MPPKRRSMKDALNAVGESSSEDEDSGKDEEVLPATANKKIKLDALERAGYSSGPSLLHIPKQPDNEPEWNWSASKDPSDKRSPTEEERSEMREIATVGVAEEAAFAQKAMEHAEKLKTDKDREKAEKAKKKQLTFREKEKRKRDAGMQSSAKNYVEEEKRIAREHGIYHGFD